jgi:hypothetical protein
LRSAIGQYVNLGERLQAIECGDHADKSGLVTYQRPADVPQPLPGAGAVDHRRLQRIAGQRLQGREIEDHYLAEELPRAKRDDRDQSGGLTGQGRLREADGNEYAIEKPGIRLEQREPDERGRNAGHHQRNNENSPYLAQPRQPHVEQECDTESENHAYRDEPDRVDRRHEQRVPASGGEYVPIIGQASETQVGVEDVSAVQAAPENHNQREHGEDDRQYENRRNEGIGGQGISPRRSTLSIVEGRSPPYGPGYQCCHGQEPEPLAIALFPAAAAFFNACCGVSCPVSAALICVDSACEIAA